jgi:hypothetical protein
MIKPFRTFCCFQGFVEPDTHNCPVPVIGLMIEIRRILSEELVAGGLLCEDGKTGGL